MLTNKIKILSAIGMVALLLVPSTVSAKEENNCLERILLRPSSKASAFEFDVTSFEITNTKTKEVELLKIDMDAERIASSFRCDRAELSFFKDVNFDGYKDIILYAPTGILDNTVSWLWLYNSQKEKFEESNQFNDEIGRNVELNSIKKLLMSSSSCCAGTNQSLMIHKWKNNTVVPVLLCEFEADPYGIDDAGEMKKALKNDLDQCFKYFDKETNWEKYMSLLPK